MNAVKTVKLETIVLMDLVIVGLFYLVPTLSHLTSLPLYRFEPMRCVLLLSLLLTGNKKNAYVMAVTLPLFSFLVGGHPVFVKALLMAVELSANIFLFDLISRKVKSTAGAMFIAILASKALYYLIKYGVLAFGLLEGPMIATGLFTQLIVAVVLSVGFWKFQERRVINPSK